MAEGTKKPLGRILLAQRALSEADLERELAAGKLGGPPLATRLLQSGKLSEVAALKALSEQHGVPGIDLNQLCVRLVDLDDVPREVALQHKILPVLAREDRLFCAMASPTDKKTLDEIEFVVGKRIFAYVALEGPLVRAIVAAYDKKERGEAFYIGPSCPLEVRQKAGVPPELWGAGGGASVAGQGVEGARPKSPALSLSRGPSPLRREEDSIRPEARSIEPKAPPAPRAAAANEVRFRPSTPAMRAVRPEEKQVVVDDAMAQVSDRDDLSDADLEAASDDLNEISGTPELVGPPPIARREGQHTVLVVDDEQDIRKLLRKVLEDKGYRVVEAARGLAALQLIKADPPDLLLLDAMLPEVHGFDIAKRVKGSERYRALPIIMISAVYRGWRFAEDIKANYGVNAYLEKPFKVTDVVREVERALTTPSQRGDGERISKEAERLLVDGIKAYRAGDIETAIGLLERGVGLDPLAHRLHFHLGLLYGKKGQLYDAIQELETALQIDERHFQSLKNLAVLYQKAGFRNKAIEAWERSLGHAPDEATRQTIKEHLVGLL